MLGSRTREDDPKYLWLQFNHHGHRPCRPCCSLRYSAQLFLGPVAFRLGCRAGGAESGVGALEERLKRRGDRPEQLGRQGAREPILGRFGIVDIGRDGPEEAMANEEHEVRAIISRSGGISLG